MSPVLSSQLVANLLLSALAGILELAQLMREISLLIRHRPLLSADRELLVDLRSPQPVEFVSPIHASTVPDLSVDLIRGFP